MSIPPPPPPTIDLRLSSTEMEALSKLVARGKNHYRYMVDSLGREEFLSDEETTFRRWRFQEHYSVVDLDEGPYGGQGAQRISSADLPDAEYVNVADTEKCEIRALQNISQRGNLPDWVLNVSDVQYFQYERTFGREPVKPLTRIVRTNVASGSGSLVMRVLEQFNPHHAELTFTRDAGGAWTVEGTDGPCRASASDFFHAFLGTENATSSFWLVREHGRHLGIDGIGAVVVASAQNVAICFTHG